MRPAANMKSVCAGLLILVLMYILVVSLRQVILSGQVAARTTLEDQAAPLIEVCEGQDGHPFSALGALVTRDLQRILAEHGYYRESLDGCAGSATQQALYSYQRDNGLTATGAMNAPTLTHLGIAVPKWLLSHEDPSATSDSAQSLTSTPPVP
ncbi:peptidoglycan-binding protein [Pseudomonas mosselii]|uniref:peptidoglycan-binding domain-containing protein n=1 Tax=Pseudomonas mosselii TaxID=78327 RepID=UPI002DB80618|nr:peptidoglycan-binding domain-containing protein [Pseudomonas mosselii]MEB5932408.1 peptidoglycan-binding protein [Pseudomonas mosselii]